jgi:sigma-B regulation protein RsbQ
MRDLTDVSPALRKILTRNNVHLHGHGSRPMILCPGLGTDQTYWRFLTPYFADAWRLVLFDHIGTGDSDRSAYEVERYRSLDGYVEDVLEICEALEIRRAVFIGHSIGAMIGVRVANKDPSRIAALILLGASARYLNDAGYIGGFERKDIDEFLFMLAANHEDWRKQMASLMLGEDRPELAQQLVNTFFKSDQLIARQFSEVAWLSDSRRDVAACAKPALIVQCTGDIAVPREASIALHALMPSSTHVLINARGHYPHLTAAAETAQAMQEFLGKLTVDVG